MIRTIDILKDRSYDVVEVKSHIHHERHEEYGLAEKEDILCI